MYQYRIQQLPVCLGVVVSRYKRANNDYKDLWWDKVISCVTFYWHVGSSRVRLLAGKFALLIHLLCLIRWHWYKYFLFTLHDIDVIYNETVFKVNTGKSFDVTAFPLIRCHSYGKLWHFLRSVLLLCLLFLWFLDSCIKAKGRSALYRVSEFLGIKKRILDIRENVRGAIKTTDKHLL